VMLNFELHVKDTWGVLKDADAVFLSRPID
jgi:hypothetical protein